MAKVSQKSIVLKKLRTDGFVTRNWCLQNFISRLSAIMISLKNEGVNFTTKVVDGDYIYTLQDKPKLIEYRVNGIVVSTERKWD